MKQANKRGHRNKDRRTFCELHLFFCKNQTVRAMSDLSNHPTPTEDTIYSSLLSMFSAGPVKFLHRDSQTSHLLIHTLHTVQLITRKPVGNKRPISSAVCFVKGRNSTWTNRDLEVMMVAISRWDWYLYILHESPSDIRGLSWCIREMPLRQPSVHESSLPY